MADSTHSRAPEVFIAGAGPVGLVLALELAHHGVRSLVIDREPTSTQYPKMDITNGRSMELFRRLGFAERLRAAGVGPDYSFDVIFTVDHNHPPIAVWDLPSVTEQQARIRARNDGASPLEADQRAPQSAFEAMGRDLLRENPLVEFLEGWTFDRFEADDSGVEVAFTEAATGRTDRRRVRYLVGCDGAGSRVRRQLGVGLQGPELPKNFLVHFKSRDLETLHRFGQFWHIYCAGGIVLIAQDEKDSWTAQLPAPPGAPDDWAPEPRAAIAERLGASIKIDEILLTGLWTPRMVLADHYGGGRVFIAGDAAHQVFPTGGYGMNTGVGDAVDIGWKLAAVVNGWGGPRLLESYGVERRGVAETNRTFSGRHLGVIITFNDMVAAGRLEDAAAMLQAQRGENEFDGVEFGYRYTTSPVIVHEAGEPPPWRPEAYVPSTWPGARPPSFLLADGSALFDHFGNEMTLVDFTGEGADLAATANARGLPVKHLRVTDAAVHRVWERNLVLIRPDHHVAWRSDQVPDAPAWAAVLDHVRG